MNIKPTHSYRATLVPHDMAAEDVETAADAGALPQVRVRATDADHAKRAARELMGLNVLRVERIEPQEEAQDVDGPPPVPAELRAADLKRQAAAAARRAYA